MPSTNLRNLHFGAALLAATGGANAESQADQAAHVASPEYYSVLKENEHVLVLQMVLQPGESDAMHRHHNETVYFEKGGQLTITQPNGKSFQANVPDGHVMWHEAWTHQVTNSGESEVVAIIVEDKP